MSSTTAASDSLQTLGLDSAPAIHRNGLAPALYEETIRRGTGTDRRGGALVVDTTPVHRPLPKDKFVVKDAADRGAASPGARSTSRSILRASTPCSTACARASRRRASSGSRISAAGPTRASSFPIRLVTESPWHALFARNLFLRVEGEAALKAHQPEFHILHAPSLACGSGARRHALRGVRRPQLHQRGSC